MRVLSRIIVVLGLIIVLGLSIGLIWYGKAHIPARDISRYVSPEAYFALRLDRVSILEDLYVGVSPTIDDFLVQTRNYWLQYEELLGNRIMKAIIAEDRDGYFVVLEVQKAIERSAEQALAAQASELLFSEDASVTVLEPKVVLIASSGRSLEKHEHSVFTYSGSPAVFSNTTQKSSFLREILNNVSDTAVASEIYLSDVGSKRVFTVYTDVSVELIPSVSYTDPRYTTQISGVLAPASVQGIGIVELGSIISKISQMFLVDTDAISESLDPTSLIMSDGQDWLIIGPLGSTSQLSRVLRTAFGSEISIKQLSDGTTIKEYVRSEPEISSYLHSGISIFSPTGVDQLYWAEVNGFGAVGSDRLGIEQWIDNQHVQFETRCGMKTGSIVGRVEVADKYSLVWRVSPENKLIMSFCL